MIVLLVSTAPLSVMAVRDAAAEPASKLTADQVLTAREVAELLHLPVSTVYHLARRGDLPARRLGRTWRFLRPRIEECLWS